VIVATVTSVVNGWVPLGDRAVIAVRSHDVLTAHTPLVGQASNLSPGTFGLGPLLYWLLAIPAHFVGAAGLAVWMGIVNMAVVIGVVGLANRRGGRSLMFATAAAVALMCGSLTSETLDDIWNPAAPLMPLTLLMFLCWSVACGEYRLLPLTVLVASFVVQCHLAFAPPAAGMLAVALVGLMVARRGLARPHAGPGSPASSGAPDVRAAVPAVTSMRRWWLLALAVGLVCWSAPLLDQAIHRPGNLVRVVKGASSQGHNLGFAAGWRAVVHTVGVAPWWLRPPQQGAFGKLDDLTKPPGLLAFGSGTLLLAALVLVIVIAARRGRADIASATAIGIVLCAAVAFDAAVTRAGLLSLTVGYTLWWASPAGMWVWLVLGWSLSQLVPWPRVATMRAPPLAGTMALLSVTAIGAGVAAEGSTPPFSPVTEQAPAEFAAVHAILNRIDDALPPGASVRVDGPYFGTYDAQAAAIYELRLRRDRVVSPDLSSLLGRTYQLRGRTYQHTLTFTPGRSAFPPPGRGIARVGWPTAPYMLTITLRDARGF
jgi:hypothetical protein